jgi:hypothetical protein
MFVATQNPGDLTDRQLDTLTALQLADWGSQTPAQRP